MYTQHISAQKRVLERLSQSNKNNNKSGRIRKQHKKTQQHTTNHTRNIWTELQWIEGNAIEAVRRSAVITVVASFSTCFPFLYTVLVSCMYKSASLHLCSHVLKTDWIKPSVWHRLSYKHTRTANAITPTMTTTTTTTVVVRRR